MKKSAVLSTKSLPRLELENSLLIFDLRFSRQSADVKDWISRFPRRYGVKAGEELKDLTEFPSHMEKISLKAEGMNPQKMTVVVLGGGSVGDFGGFVASVLKRGVRLLQIPTTWLAAIDSAHGGKTALNVSGFKNQIGTFYPAEKTILVHDLLQRQPNKLAQSAISECLKIALVANKDLWIKLSKRKKSDLQSILWKALPESVATKWKVVLKDPYEQKGIRQILNFGHSFGHFLESRSGMDHGAAVGQGLVFAVQLSEHRGLISERNAKSILSVLQSYGIRKVRKALKIGKKEFIRTIAQDKKMDSHKTMRLRFIFLRGVGRPVVESLPVEELYNFALEREWIR